MGSVVNWPGHFRSPHRINQLNLILILCLSSSSSSSSTGYHHNDSGETMPPMKYACSACVWRCQSQAWGEMGVVLDAVHHLLIASSQGPFLARSTDWHLRFRLQTWFFPGYRVSSPTRYRPVIQRQPLFKFLFLRELNAFLKCEDRDVSSLQLYSHNHTMALMLNLFSTWLSPWQMTSVSTVICLTAMGSRIHSRLVDHITEMPFPIFSIRGLIFKYNWPFLRRSLPRDLGRLNVVGFLPYIRSLCISPKQTVSTSTIDVQIV